MCWYDGDKHALSLCLCVLPSLWRLAIDPLNTTLCVMIIHLYIIALWWVGRTTVTNGSCGSFYLKKILATLSVTFHIMASLVIQ
jgi:hypothetical protein